jgi:hypothetical protein
VAARANVSYSVVASNPPNSGPWFISGSATGVAIPNATSATLNITNAGSADSGVYTVNVGNDGGVTGSLPVTLTVNAAPVAGADSIQATQNVARTISTASLLGNDTDPSGGTLSIIAVSGRAPAIVSTNFNDGVSGQRNSLWIAGQTNAYLRINDSVGSRAGSDCASTTLSQADKSPRSPRASACGSVKGADSRGWIQLQLWRRLARSAPQHLRRKRCTSTGFTFAIDNYQFVPIAIGNVRGLQAAPSPIRPE